MISRFALAIVIIMALLGPVACSSTRTGSGLEATALLARSMDVAMQPGPFGFGPGMAPTYEIGIRLRNGSSKSIRFKYLNVVAYADGGDALQLASFQASNDPPPFVVNPGDTVSFDLGTDGYTQALEASGKQLRIGIAMTDDLFKSGMLLTGDLPNRNDLPDAPLVAQKQTQAVQVPLSEERTVDIQLGRVAKKIQEWPSQPSVIVDRGSYRTVYLYFEARP